MFNLMFRETFTVNLLNSFPILKTLQQKAKHGGFRGKKGKNVVLYYNFKN